LRKLHKLGWEVLVVWECEAADIKHLTPKVRRFLAS
jgi:G:T-mismatch repair DNA endonuclease (very short patch repair protein)